MIRAQRRTRGGVQVLARRRAESHSLAAPVGGWNARDSFADMDSTDAIVLDNFFPDTDSVRNRNGFTSHATGVVDSGSDAASVESLMPYEGLTTTKLFAAGGDQIFEVTSSGAVGSADVTSLTNARFQHVMFGTSAGNFLLCVNGADAIQYFDGSSWATITGATSPAITGVTTSTLVHVNAFKNRLFFVQVNTLSVWYLPVQAIGGAALELDFSSYCTMGGTMQAMATWTRDGGNGMDDFAVFITSRGEVLVFQGADPSSSTNWVMVGRYVIGAPIGRRCFFQAGAELIVLTVDGFIPLSRVLAAGRTDPKMAVSDKIVRAVNDAVRDYGSNFGWQGILYPQGRMALFNIPVESSGAAEQYVVNMSTAAWCRFTGMNAQCWAVYQDDLYFGAPTGIVYKADNGLQDAGSAISLDAQQAFSYFGKRGVLKRFAGLRPLIRAYTNTAYSIGIAVDYNSATLSEPSEGTFTNALWGSAKWGAGLWAGPPTIRTSWQSVSGLGYAGSINLKMSVLSEQIEWHATDVAWEDGGLI